MPLTKEPSIMSRLHAQTAPRRSTRNHHSTTITTAAPNTSRHSRHSTRTHHASAPVIVTTTTATPVRHHKRKPIMGDKISGAMLKVKGSLSGRPGQKAAGTRCMRGTDGRGTRRYY